MAVRNASSYAEALVADTSHARVASIYAEAIVADTSHARVSSVYAEALVEDRSHARVASIYVEALVEGAVIVSVAVTPPQTTLGYAKQQQFKATATLSSGSTLDVTDEVTWSCSEGSISGTGLFTSGPTNNDTAIIATFVQSGLPNVLGVANVTVTDDIFSQPTFDYVNNSEFVWALLIYDQNGKLVDIPQADIASIDVEDVINGGSAAGTIVFRRPFNTIGALGFRYLFQLFIWQRYTPRPADPYWSGHFTDFEQKELDTTGEITVTCDGDFKLLDDAIVDVNINPGVGGNPSLDAGQFTLSLLDYYQSSAYFGSPTVPLPMFPLEPTQFTNVALGDALDTITKIGRNDTTGQLFIWHVRTKGDLTRKVIVEADPDPNVDSSVKFIHLFKDAQLVNYDVQTKYADVFNVVAVFGGQDENGAQVYGVYEDTASIAALGAAIETTLSNSSICSAAAAAAYAKNQLDLHSSPVATGTFDLLTPNPDILAGVWVQIWETPQIPSAEATIKQVRISDVKISIKGDRITQTCSLTSPVPYLDDAIYRLGTEVAVQAAILNTETPANRQSIYVRAGGQVTSTSSDPAEITTSPVEAVFPNVGIVNAAGFGPAQLIDNSGGANEGQNGDGHYTLSITSAGAYVVTKGATPMNTAVQQNLVSIWVQGGVPFVTDVRTLVYGTASDSELTAPIVSSVAVTDGPDTGFLTTQFGIDFTLSYPLYTSPYLNKFVVDVYAATSGGARRLIPNEGGGFGSGSSTSTAVVGPQRSIEIDPNDTNAYSVGIALASDRFWTLELRSIDQLGRTSASTILATVPQVVPAAGVRYLDSNGAATATGFVPIGGVVPAVARITNTSSLTVALPGPLSAGTWTVIARASAEVINYVLELTLSGCSISQESPQTNGPSRSDAPSYVEIIGTAAGGDTPSVTLSFNNANSASLERGNLLELVAIRTA
jgi:hypothetical protein